MGVLSTAAQNTITVSVGAPDQVAVDTDFVARINISNVENFDAANYDVSFDARLSVIQSKQKTAVLMGSGIGCSRGQRRRDSRLAVLRASPMSVGIVWPPLLCIIILGLNSRLQSLVARACRSSPYQSQPSALVGRLA